MLSPLPVRSARSGKAFCFLTTMSKIPYHKPPLNYSEQLEQLKQRGLHVENDEKALHLLGTVSYYRLSGYWFPLLEDKKRHQFKARASFENAFNLYKFDRELRQLISGELEKIEVAVRSQMIYQLSFENGPFWFLNGALFGDALKHANTINKIGSELKRSDEEFIKEFYKNYLNEAPPSWMTLEVTSFGSLSFLYANLKGGRNKRKIAKYFGVSDSVFQSWLHSIVYIRNVCAHHSRLWNRDMRIQPVIPFNPRNPWLSNTSIANNKTYFVLSMIVYLLNTINPNHSFKSRFKSLLLKYPNIDPKAMGFPEKWDEEVFWK